MVKVIESLIGKEFGKLTVVEQADDYISPKGRHKDRWKCICSCENKIVFVSGDNLRRKITQSCGCLRKDTTSKLSEKNKKTNKYDISGDYGIGWTSNTNKEFYFDLEDYNLIQNYCWCEHVHRDGYSSLEAWDSQNKKMIYMSWLIVGMEFDHINRNSFDNRKSNLRPASDTENAQNHSKRKDNTSGVTGVFWNKQRQQWQAYIQVNKNNMRLGFFDNKDDAIRIRLKAECKYFGDFAPQKHLYTQYNIIGDEKNND